MRQTRFVRTKRIAVPYSALGSTASNAPVIILSVAALFTMATISLFSISVTTNSQQTTQITNIDTTCFRLMANVSVLDMEVGAIEDGAGTDPVLNETVFFLEEYIDVTEQKANTLIQDAEFAIMNAVDKQIIRLDPGIDEMNVTRGTWVFGNYWVVTNCFCNNMRVNARLEGLDPDTLAVVLPVRTFSREIPKGIQATIKRTVMSEPIVLSNNQTLIVFDNIGSDRAIGSASYFFAVKVS